MQSKLIATGALILTSVVIDLPGYASELAGAWLTQPTESASGSNFIVFEHKDTSWSGFSVSPFGKVQLTNVVVQGKDVSFDAVLDLGIAPSPPPAVTIHGTLNDDELRLVVPSPLGRTKERIAHRVSATQIPSANANSLQIPLLLLPYNGLAPLPPMGWNSWNKFGLKANDRTIREIADALVDTGLRDAGYVYVNIDDGWEGQRDAHGVLHPNERYPDMKVLADYVHSRGLKLGIYSSPGPHTCGGFEGSFGHEEQDAKMYAEWGVDYLKYDWCSADKIYDTPAEMQAAYLKMGTALRITGRPIVYALCQYGLFNVGNWGREVGANLWRTTFDILDTWQDMERIGFNDAGKEDDEGPGGWNDPDMLEVGNGGMTLDEYRTHFTLWSMRSAPLLLGNDVSHMSEDIKSLLTNKEVIAIDQDPLGKQASRVQREGTTEIWTKKLSNGDIAVAFFNRNAKSAAVRTRWSDIGVTNVDSVRDLWRQKDLDDPQAREYYRAVLAPHGTTLLRLKTSASLDVVFIGDSITMGYAVPIHTSQFLSKEAHIGGIRISNQGHAGYTTVNFLPSQGETFAAVEQAATELTRSSADTLVFSVMLGTNDSAMNGPLGSPVDSSSYRKNLEVIIDRLILDYPRSRIVVHRPIWYSPNTYNGARYLADGLQRLESYFKQIDMMVEDYGHTHPGHVFSGDRDAFAFFRNDYMSYLRPEEGHEGTFYLHPNAEGAEALGRFWAAAISRSLQ